MKTCIICALILMAPLQAHGSPFLTCDDYTVSSGQTVADLPDRFELVIDGTLVNSPAVDIVTGGTVTGRRLMYDLSGISVGAHTLIGRACNLWGCSSDSNPYSFTRSASGKPVNIRLTK